jgi:hypothetical protein
MSTATGILEKSKSTVKEKRSLFSFKKMVVPDGFG